MASTLECYTTRLDGADAGIHVLHLSRPLAKNALGSVLLQQMAATIATMHRNSHPQTLIIKSETDGVFCAGADLKERRLLTLPQTALLVSELRTVFNAIAQLPFPTICVVNGVALGGGLELALAADFRVACCDAKMGLVETRMGIIPGTVSIITQVIVLVTQVLY